MSLLDQVETVYCPEEVLWHADSQEFGAGHTRQRSTINMDGKERAQHTALWYAGVKGESGGAVVV